MKTVRVQNTTTTTTIQNSGQWTDDIRLFKFIDPSKTSKFPYYCKQQARLWFPGLNFRFTKVFFFFLHATAVNVSVSLAAVQDNQSKNKRTKTNCMKRKLHDTKGHYNSDHIYM